MKEFIIGFLSVIVIAFLVINIKIDERLAKVKVEIEEMYTMDDMYNVLEVVENMQDANCEEWYVVNDSGLTAFKIMYDGKTFITTEIKYTMMELMEMSVNND
jgi:hypothetical protein